MKRLKVNFQSYQKALAYKNGIMFGRFNGSNPRLSQRRLQNGITAWIVSYDR